MAESPQDRAYLLSGDSLLQDHLVPSQNCSFLRKVKLESRMRRLKGLAVNISHDDVRSKKKRGRGGQVNFLLYSDPIGM